MTYGDTLFQRLRLAERPDLIALLEDLKKDPREFKNASNEDIVTALSAELRSVAGNSFVNAVRSPHEFSYKQILIDVADKLAEGLRWTKFTISGPETADQIEEFIEDRVRVLLERHLNEMDAEDKVKLQAQFEADLRVRGINHSVAQGGLSAALASAVAGGLTASLVASALYGGLWSFLVGTSLRQLVLGGIAGGGPIGIAVGAAVLVTGTSYSKTIPAVTRLIMIRRSYEARSKLKGSQ